MTALIIAIVTIGVGVFVAVWCCVHIGKMADSRAPKPEREP